MAMIMMTIMVMINMLVDISNFQAWFHPSRASQSQNNSQGPTLYDAFILYAPRDEVWHVINCIIIMILNHHHKHRSQICHHCEFSNLQAFLQQVLVPGLDANGGSYRLCLQHRYQYE